MAKEAEDLDGPSCLGFADMHRCFLGQVTTPAGPLEGSYTS